MIKGITPGQGSGPQVRVETVSNRAVSDGKPVGKTEAVAPAAGSIHAGATQAALVAAGAPYDAAKVAQLKARIAAGDYPIDARKIAEAMVDQDLGWKKT